MYHPRNVVISVVALLAVAVVLMVRPDGSPAAAPAAPEPAQTQVVEQPTWSPTPAETQTPVAAVDPHTSAIGTAEAFATAWAKPNLAQSEWLAGIEQWSTPRLFQQLAFTDPAKVPATLITGEAGLVKYGKDWAWAWIQVPTNGGTIMLSLVSSSPDTCTSICQTWLVNNVQPADQAPPATSTGKALE
jgi:hypothetical protein